MESSCSGKDSQSECQPCRLLWLISGVGADGFRARRRFGAFCGQDLGLRHKNIARQPRQAPEGGR
jgi:hypothetical protein